MPDRVRKFFPTFLPIIFALSQQRRFFGERHEKNEVQIVKHARKKNYEIRDLLHID